jgi:AcrR family transcriptional regulator
VTDTAASPGAGVPARSPAPEQRDRILDTALRLMAERGVSATSMRRLADGCGLNVATLYHYFPSKADLFAAVIAHQRYDDLLATEVPTVERGAPVRRRAAQLLAWIWDQMSNQDQVWRLLLGESLRGEAHALTAAADLSEAFETALVGWVAEYLPDLPGEPAATARVLRSAIFGQMVDTLPLAPDDRRPLYLERAADVAAALVPFP